MRKTKEWGIDRIFAYVPPLRLPAKEVSDGTGENIKKFVSGLGINNKAVTVPSQNTTSLAMNAVEGLLMLNPSGYKAWKYVHVATESSFDDSKPIASELLDVIPKNNLIIDDRKAACISAINAILENTSFGPGLIVASDLGWYKIDENEGLSEDFTGGSGAIAVEIGKGDLLKLEEEYGVYSSNKYDFYKACTVKDDMVIRKLSPKVYKTFSKVCYLYHIGEAYKDLKKKTGCSLKDFDGLVFHVPYPSLPKHALSYLDMIDGGNSEDVEEKLVDLMSLFDFRHREDYHEKSAEGYHDVKKILETNLEKKKSLVSRLAPSLVFPSETGNLCTGSGLLSLCSSLVFSDYSNKSRIGCFWYGSGSSSVAFVLRTTSETKKRTEECKVKDQFDRRKTINWEESQALNVAGLAPGSEWNAYLRPGDWYVSEDDEGVKKYERFRG